MKRRTLSGAGSSSVFTYVFAALTCIVTACVPASMPGGPCTPGTTRACACLGARSGTQTCDDSAAYGPCSCDDAGGADVGRDEARLDAAAGCELPQRICGGACVNVSESPSHCGSCNTRCASDQYCRAGECVCPPGQTRCGDRCIGTQTDARNCGGCGVLCQFNRAFSAGCRDGVCVMGACDTGFANCNGSSTDGCEIDVSTDAMHCGACGMACAAGEVCLMGVCQIPCPSGQIPCGGACTPVVTDWRNCGACGRMCETYESCEGAACCSREGATCHDGRRCCAGSTCVSAAGGPRCMRTSTLCSDPFARCTSGATCCSGVCNAGACCGVLGNQCNGSPGGTDCCTTDLTCFGNRCCKVFGARCTTNDDCCNRNCSLGACR